MSFNVEINKNILKKLKKVSENSIAYFKYFFEKRTAGCLFNLSIKIGIYVKIHFFIILLYYQDS